MSQENVEIVITPCVRASQSRDTTTMTVQPAEERAGVIGA